MYLRELFSEPEVDEAVKTIWSRSGGKQVRKYRCTSGQRKGRIVAKAATCNAPLNQKAKITLSKTKKDNNIKIAAAIESPRPNIVIFVIR